MGADIYLKSISDKAKAEHQPMFNAACRRREAATTEDERKAIQAEVERHYDAMYPDDGYFRDSYNRTSLFWLYGLSWWQSPIDSSGHLPIDEAKTLRDKLVTTEFPRSKIESEFKNSDDPVDSWVEMFTNKRTRLIALLDKSIELNEPLYCSV